MNYLDRIEEARRKFGLKFGGMDDEYSEMFYHACEFAMALDDTNDRKLLDIIMQWIEAAPDAENNY